MRGDGLITSALALALALNFANSARAQDADTPVAETLPEHLAYLYEERARQDVASQLYAGGRTWQAGDTLKVCFFGGNPVVRALVVGVAAEWSNYANIRMDFGVAGQFRNCRDRSAGFSQIRIGFAEKGYWSAVGTDGDELLNAYQPSMNLERFDFLYSPYQPGPGSGFMTVNNVVASARVRDKAVILHEFGHAIGLLHEHQNPALGCQTEVRWDGEGSVYQYYGRPPNNWDRDTVNRNLGPVARTDPDAVSGKADRASIMIYAQPAQIFIKGAASPCYVPEPLAISAGDKALVAKLYPAGVQAPSDTQFTTAGFSTNAAAANVPAFAVSDMLERIKADLSSPLASARREARKQLAIEIGRGPSTTFTNFVATTATGNDYRQQLGLAVAIDRTSSPPQLDAAQAASIRSDLLRIKSKARDATLKDATTSALNRLGLQ